MQQQAALEALLALGPRAAHLVGDRELVALAHRHQPPADLLLALAVAVVARRQQVAPRGREPVVAGDVSAGVGGDLRLRPVVLDRHGHDRAEEALAVGALEVELGVEALAHAGGLVGLEVAGAERVAARDLLLEARQLVLGRGGELLGHGRQLHPDHGAAAFQAAAMRCLVSSLSCSRSAWSVTSSSFARYSSVAS